MATRTVGWFSAGPAEVPAARRTGKSRYFFAYLAAFYALVAIAGFAPNLLLTLSGALELSWAAHVHGVLMASWLALVVTQAALPAAGRVRLHRRLGTATAFAGLLIWLSMIIVSLHPVAARNPPQGAFLFNILLLQAQAALLFPLFFGWAVWLRHRPGWHKRLIVLTMIAPMGAAVDRMAWLPVGGIVHQWPRFLYLDLLLVPLIVFDLATIRRVHPATLTGAAILLVTQAVMTLLWDTPAWHAFAWAATAFLR